MEKVMKIKLIAGILSVCIIISVLSIVLVKKYTPSETMRTLDNYYDVAPEEAVVLLENEIYAKHALLKEGGIYLPWEMVKSLLNKDFYLDEEEQVLLYALPESLIRTSIGETVYYEEEEPVSLGHPVILQSENEYYISLEFTERFTNMTYKFYENPNRVVIHYKWSEFLFYDTTAEGTPIRIEPDIKSDILRRVPAGETLYYVAGTGMGSQSFVKVMTQDGIYGYVQKKFLGESYYKALQSNYTEPEYTHLALEEAVQLGWHSMGNAQANGNLEQLVKCAGSMNVISPTWYQLSDSEGNFTSFADKSYVERAHEMGLQVWALISNFENDVNSFDLLSSSSKRKTLIDNMMAEAAEYGFDGWNVDFESLNTPDGPHYIQFLKELSIRCRKAGLILSVDNYVPAPYNGFYDLRTQGKIADYVIIMAYDEHFAGSDHAGSVSSLGFFKDAVNDTLTMVPKERTIIAIPFYTRLWTETEQDGGSKVSSKALVMSEAKKVLEQNNVTAEWDAVAGQNYAEYKADGNTYKIWLEDVDSVHERMRVIAGAGVAGVAAWRLGYETEEIWPVIDLYLD